MGKVGKTEVWEEEGEIGDGKQGSPEGEKGKERKDQEERLRDMASGRLRVGEERRLAK